MSLSIALIIWKLDYEGGAPRQFLQLAQNLKKMGHKVHIFTRIYDEQNCYPSLTKGLLINSPKELERQDIPLLPTDSLLIKITKFIQNIFISKVEIDLLSRLLLQHDQREHYDVLNFHDHTCHVLAQRLNHRNTIWMMNDLPPLIDTFERGATQFAQTFLGRCLYPILANVEKRRAAAFIKIIVLDKRNQGLVLKHLHTQSEVIRSGVDLEVIKGVKIKKSSKKPLKVLLTGIFQLHRRYEDYLKALFILKKENIKLDSYIVGAPRDEAYYNDITLMIEKLNLEDSVHLLGSVSEEKLASLYNEANVFVFPNNNQTWGLAVFEAMLNKCATLVSTGSGASEVLDNMENAILFPPKCPKQLATALKLVYLDERLRSSLGKQGQKFVKTNLSWAKYAESMEKVFISAVGDKYDDKQLPMKH